MRLKKINQSRRVVLASGFANEGMDELLTHSQWEFLYSISPDPAATTEYVWRIDPKHSFHYFECTNYPVEYCMVVGPQHDEVLMQISTLLNFLDVDDLSRAFDIASTVEEKEVTTFALGLGGGDALEDSIYKRIQLALNDPSPRVRLAAIDAAFITGWEIFQTDIERLSKDDPDPIVSTTAANALVGITST